ncbi:hypothetical protein GCM10020000_80540 [Streptomyces olivoverticillatus]
MRSSRAAGTTAGPAPGTRCTSWRTRRSRTPIAGPCAGGLKPPVGAAGPSCDEYPFAATYEGGTALPPASRGITWVPVRENNRQGGILNKFQLQQRILDRDGFWVQV